MLCFVVVCVVVNCVTLSLSQCCCVVDDDDLDRFGDALDSGQDLSAVKTGSKTDSQSALDEVQWEFKWENKGDASMYGPFGTRQMSDWKDEG